MVEEVSQSFSSLEGCFYPRLCWKKLSNCNKKKLTAVYFSSSFSKQNFKKRNITFTENVKPVSLLKSHLYFLSPDVNEFLQLGKALLVRKVQCVGEFLMLSYSLF